MRVNLDIDVNVKVYAENVLESQVRVMVLPTIMLKRMVYWGHIYPEIVAAVLCAGLALLGWLALQGGWADFGIWLLLAGYVIGGYESAREGLTTLWQEHELDVDLLMIVAALGAAMLGLWQREYYLLVDGAVLILIFAFSGALETIAMHRTERNIRSLMQLTPDTARRLRLGQEQMVATQDLQVGDHILVKPGELIPIDGLIRIGHSAINQAPITGESIPVEKSLGDEVFAGTINGNGPLTVELHKPPESSLIQRIIRLVEQAKTSQPPSQQFLERFERGYARFIVTLGLALALLPPLLLGWSWEVTIYRALIFLVVASPCALMASIMPTLLSGIAQGARQGILFKDGAQLENIGRVKAIAFDKTGTLTTGILQVSDIVAAPAFQSEQVLQILASLEVYSEHPIAQAIVQTAKNQNIPLLSMDSVKVDVGQGIEGVLEGIPTRAGKLTYVMAELADPIDASLFEAGQQFESEEKTNIWISQHQQAIGLLAVADQVRPQAPGLLSTLKQVGISAIVMLTGDNKVTAQTVAQSIGINEVYSDLLPEDKVTAIQHLQDKYQTVAMVGDGINDAPALAQATVGIAMGRAGSDVALETADIVLMADRLDKLEQAIGIGKKSQRIIKQNITLALSSLALLMIANFFGELTLPAGVLGHEGSTLLVTLNGLRLLRA